MEENLMKKNIDMELKSNWYDTLYNKCVSEVSTVVCELSPEGTVVFVNDAVVNATGYYPEELLGKNWWDMLFPGELSKKIETFYKIFNTTMDVSNFEAPIMTKEGVLKVFEWKSSNHYLSNGTLHNIVLYGFDVTACFKLRETLKSMLIIDSLTGVFNRKGFFKCAYQRLREEEEQKELTLIFIHLYNLPYINETYGHREGDRALINLAMVLKDTFRQSDIIGRTRGNEFVVLMRDMSPLTEESIRERLQENLQKRNGITSQRPDLSISVDKMLCKPEHLISFERFSQDIEGAIHSHTTVNQEENREIFEPVAAV